MLIKNTIKVGQALRQKQNKLNIVFHNPNSEEDTVKILISIAAEIAMNKISDEIIHRTRLEMDTNTLR